MKTNPITEVEPTIASAPAEDSVATVTLPNVPADDLLLHLAEARRVAAQHRDEEAKRAAEAAARVKAKAERVRFSHD